MRKVLAPFLLTFVIGTQAQALTVKDYKTAKAAGGRSFEETTLYLYGIGEGYGWANSAIQSNGGKRLYCQPDLFFMQPQNYLEAIDRMVARLHSSETDVVENLMLKGLQEEFPCR